MNQSVHYGLERLTWTLKERDGGQLVKMEYKLNLPVHNFAKDQTCSEERLLCLSEYQL